VSYLHRGGEGSEFQPYDQEEDSSISIKETQESIQKGEGQGT
jgi:hypothetical protein